MITFFNCLSYLIEALIPFFDSSNAGTSDVVGEHRENRDLNHNLVRGDGNSDSCPQSMKCIGINENEDSRKISSRETFNTSSNSSKVDEIERLQEISPLFKKYLPESPEISEANGFEQYFESLLCSDEWDSGLSLPPKYSPPVSYKSDPAILPTHQRDFTFSYHSLVESDFPERTSDDEFLKRTRSDTNLMGVREQVPDGAIRAHLAERRFGLEWNEKHIETLLKYSETDEDVFLILYVQKRDESTELVQSCMVTELLKSFIHPHKNIKVCWEHSLAKCIFSWMSCDSLVAPLFPTQSLYEPYDAALLFSHSATFLVRHPNLVFFHNIARVLQIAPRRLLLLQAVAPAYP